jgi:hypothetical protein
MLRLVAREVAAVVRIGNIAALARFFANAPYGQ